MMWLFETGEVDIGHNKMNCRTNQGLLLGYWKVILVHIRRWSYGSFWDDSNILHKMKNDLTTRTWQDDIWCPINIILFCTSDACPHRPPLLLPLSMPKNSPTVLSIHLLHSGELVKNCGAYCKVVFGGSHTTVVVLCCHCPPCPHPPVIAAIIVVHRTLLFTVWQLWQRQWQFNLQNLTNVQEALHALPKQWHQEGWIQSAELPIAQRGLCHRHPTTTMTLAPRKQPLTPLALEFGRIYDFLGKGVIPCVFVSGAFPGEIKRTIWSVTFVNATAQRAWYWGPAFWLSAQPFAAAWYTTINHVRI